MSLMNSPIVTPEELAGIGLTSFDCLVFSEYMKENTCFTETLRIFGFIYYYSSRTSISASLHIFNCL